MRREQIEAIAAGVALLALLLSGPALLLAMWLTFR